MWLVGFARVGTTKSINVEIFYQHLDLDGIGRKMNLHDIYNEIHKENRHQIGKMLKIMDINKSLKTGPLAKVQFLLKTSHTRKSRTRRTI